MKRIPSLDGLRAVSIGLVLSTHAYHTAGFPRQSVPAALGDTASLGVRVFFVISGFLITTLLLEEIARSGGISLRAFYLRRTLRIFPAFYVFVGAIAAAEALGYLRLKDGDLLAALTYTTNYHHDRAWYLGHTWSLAVEEQFYLLWPLAMKWLGARRALLFAGGVIAGAPLIRVGVRLVGGQEAAFGIGETFPTVADAIAAGCLLAGAHRWLAARPRYVAFLRSPLFWLVPVTVLVVYRVPWVGMQWLVGETVTNLGIALVIDAFVHHRAGLARRLLEAPAVAKVGVLSYSLYLWQQPFLNRESTAAFARFPLNLVCTGAAALVSYWLVERTFLALRRRLERPHAGGWNRLGGRPPRHHPQKASASISSCQAATSSHDGRWK